MNFFIKFNNDLFILSKSKNPVKLDQYTEGWHGCYETTLSLDLIARGIMPEGEKALKEAGEFVRKHCG